MVESYEDDSVLVEVEFTVFLLDAFEFSDSFAGYFDTEFVDFTVEHFAALFADAESVPVGFSGVDEVAELLHGVVETFLDWSGLVGFGEFEGLVVSSDRVEIDNSEFAIVLLGFSFRLTCRRIDQRVLHVLSI